MTKKTLLKSIYGIPSSRYPVWFLRQAGRYLPEYRALRKKYDFLDLCYTPKKAAEITLQPLNRFDLDAAIIFSDILTPLTAIGQNLTFKKNHGPIITPTIETKDDLLALNLNNIPEKLNYVGEAINLVKSKLSSDKSLIGFAGSAFTVASYMIQGESDKTFLKAKHMAFTQPQLFSDILNFLNDLTFQYLTMQASAGADVVMLFDSWAGYLSPADYQSIIFPHLFNLLKKLKSLNLPIIYYPGNNPDTLKVLDTSLLDVVAIDWRCSLADSINQVKKSNPKISIQGNLDPVVLHANESMIRKKVRDILQTTSQICDHKHIFNVGHGLLPSTPIASLHWVIDEIRKFQI